MALIFFKRFNMFYTASMLVYLTDKTKWCLLFVFLCLFSVLKGQEQKTFKDYKNKLTQAPEVRYDTSYIYQFKEAWVLRPLVAYRDFSFGIHQKGLPDKLRENVSFLKTGNHYAGIGGTFYNTQMQLFFGIPTNKKSQQSVSKNIDINLSLHTHRYNGLLFIKQFGSFYTSNEKTIQKRDDILLKNYGASLFYVCNDNFSIEAVYKHSRLQKKNQGSVLLRFDISHLNIESDSSLINWQMPQSNNQITNRITNIKTSGINIQTAYIYSVVFRKWYYLSAAAFAGIGPQWTPNLNNNHLLSINYSFNYRFFTGYSSPRFIWGIIIDSQYSYIPVKTISYKTFSSFAKLTAGIRI